MAVCNLEPISPSESIQVGTPLNVTAASKLIALAVVGQTGGAFTTLPFPSTATGGWSAIPGTARSHELRTSGETGILIGGIRYQVFEADGTALFPLQFDTAVGEPGFWAIGVLNLLNVNLAAPVTVGGTGQAFGDPAAGNIARVVAPSAGLLLSCVVAYRGVTTLGNVSPGMIDSQSCASTAFTASYQMSTEVIGAGDTGPRDFSVPAGGAFPSCVAGGINLAIEGL